MRNAVGIGRERGEKELEASGVSRRDFMKFCTAVAVTMGFGPAFATDVAAALTGKRPSVVYLHEAECTGCSEALLRTASPFIDDLILDTISLDYHETIMAAAGEAAEGALEQAVSNPDGFIAVVEGAIPTADNGQYGYIAGHTMLETCRRILPKAKLVVCMGTCSAYGGEQAAKHNPNQAKGVNDAFADLGVKAVIAKSFARIHKANLINNAIIPMTFANPADYDDFNLGDVLSFSDLPAQIKARKVTVKNETTGKTYELNLELGERQERLLLEGGLLTSIKHGK